MASGDRRVVISGLGPVSAAGVGMDPLWEAMCAGTSAISRIGRFDATGFPSQHGGEVSAEAFKIRDVVPKSYRKATKVMARDIELAVAAAATAIAHAKIETKATSDGEPTIPASRMGCHIGAGFVAADIDELTTAMWQSRDDDGVFDLGAWGSGGMGDLTPLWLLKYLPNMLACHVTIIHDCQGPSNTITCNESSGMLSLGESMRVIRRGAADACLSGGCDSKLNPMGFVRQIFADRIAESTCDETAHTIQTPYAATARGSLSGEGGGILVLEALDALEARGGTALAEVAGFAATQSMCPDTFGCERDPDDDAVAMVMKLAIADAGLTPDEIDAVVPFGSSIPVADAVDRDALLDTFGDRAATLPLVLPMPFVGNVGAGIGPLSVAVAARCLVEQKLPARIATTGVDDLAANACEACDADLRAIVVFTTSLGGHNAAVVLKRIDGGAQ
jgi:3-oxoacyl-[acyl-carrier-protein] synthase II